MYFFTYKALAEDSTFFTDGIVRYDIEKGNFDNIFKNSNDVTYEFSCFSYNNKMVCYVYRDSSKTGGWVRALGFLDGDKIIVLQEIPLTDGANYEEALFNRKQNEFINFAHSEKGGAITLYEIRNLSGN